MIIVTGGAGFIGSNIVKGLNDRGREDVLIVDNLTNMVKFKNIQGLKALDYMDKQNFIDAIKKRWILREIGSGTREIFMSKIGEISKELDIFMQLQDFEEIKTIVLNNTNTVTVLSKVIVEKELKQKKLFEIKLKNIEFKREFYLVYHKDKTKNLLFETFIEFIKNRFN